MLLYSSTYVAFSTFCPESQNSIFNSTKRFRILAGLSCFRVNNNLYFLKGVLKRHVIEKSTVNSLAECGLKCTSLQPDCKSLNYVTKHPGQPAICEINNSSKRHAHKDDFVRLINSKYFELNPEENQHEIQDVNKVIFVFLLKTFRYLCCVIAS